MAWMTFSTLRRSEKRKMPDRSLSTSSGLTETTTEVAFLDSLESRFLLRYLAEMIVVSFAFLMDYLRKGNSWSSWSGRPAQGI